jgi:phytoene/squalene synthetase
MAKPPFFFLRPGLLARDVLVNRDEPNLGHLARIEDPERFVWAILPHAARTFSACIALLPKRAAKASAVGYLYCRMNDTYEDLVVDPAERDTALRDFAARLAEADPEAGVPPAPPIHTSNAKDGRDAAHLLLVRRCGHVDRVYLTLEPEVRGLINRLVMDMAAGMRWSSATFHRQGGVLENDQQLARYCRNVLGHPVLFASRLLHYQQTGDPELPDKIARDAMTVGEMVQLANITRDIEKDLLRGVAYHPLLRDDLGRAVGEDAELAERVRAVREELMLMALQRAPSYRPLIEFLSPRRVSMARASGVLMMQFTDRYYRSCARRAGHEPWGRRRSGVRLMLSAMPATWSRSWGRKVLSRIEEDFLRAVELWGGAPAAGLPPAIEA